MTAGITRRRVLGGAIVALVTRASPLVAAGHLNIPGKPMRLVRRLERGMRGGAVITVERAWKISFRPQDAGIAVSGEQISVSVDAPEALAPLARIERSRSTSEMFPIRLTANGSIASIGPYAESTDLAQAVRKAEAEISQRAIPAAAKAQQKQYLAQLQRAAGSFLDQLPRDLFFPAAQPSRTVREVSLPNGLVGEFEVLYEARQTPDHGWLDLAVRRVVTRIGDSERHSREVWSMSEIQV